MRENLFFRTETLPEEIPILFNNKNLYQNFNRGILNSIIDKENDKKKIFSSVITVPYYFYIPKNNSDQRKMSLLHPFAQLQMFKYILRYEQMIVSFCKQSKYSVRSPIIRNNPVFNITQAIKKETTKIEEEFNFTNEQSITSEETAEYFHNYFSYKNFKKITDLHKSNKFKRDLYKYNHFKKLDIQNFFSSIYSHSIAWAIFGDKSIAKRYKGPTYDNIFPNASDKICQIINFNETNGIVVGPEFSRVISEVLLSRVDIDLYKALEIENLIKEKDYKIYRFMDDYHIFFNESKTIKLIEENLIKSLDSYNLKLNLSKSSLQNKPFQFNDVAITKLIYIIDTYKISEDENPFKFRSKLQKIRDNIELLILEHPNSTTKILNYFLKYIRSVIKFENDKISLSIILELITNIYSLKINYHSTHNLIATYAMLSQKIKRIKSEDILDDIEEEKLEKIKYLEEKFFQHLFILLRNNFNHIPQMYDIFIYMKALPKKISSDFLCKTIQKYSGNYFVLCSIAYYILDDDLKAVQSNFKTVLKVLTTSIHTFISNYKNKGADYIFFESDYFYLLNDFSYYPGFNAEFKLNLRTTLLEGSSYKKIFSSLSDREILLNNIIEKITQSSYYDWGKTSDYFIKEIAKKSSNLLNRRQGYN
ncbi:RNA-directed DNA polymerase [Planococcus ruber]|uniref:RNA-directed DNA polymerase n=1 Tax=Planococcus ruber TaxID=2027871 RepID=UPI001FED5A24|nr:RNA-directed DNA polymerase [Planococcus ruber]MCJ1909213.1 RNA-directed DNA polymerase [Planococcus ruber]